jgi:hypothetical protein
VAPYNIGKRNATNRQTDKQTNRQTDKQTKNIIFVLEDQFFDFVVKSKSYNIIKKLGK